MDVNRKLLVEQLVDLMREALLELNWQGVRSLAAAVTEIDPQNEVAGNYLKAAIRAMSEDELSRPRIKLHDEISAILEEAQTGLSYSKIASLVNERSRYHKRDGTAVRVNQIRARVVHPLYDHLFDLKDGLVHLADRGT